MNETTDTGEVIDVTDESDTAALRARLAAVQAELEQAHADLGRLRLQVELFSSTDPVTGFVNRGGTVEAIQSGLDRVARMSEPFGIIAVRFPELAATRDDLTDDELVDALRYLGALVGGGLRRVDRVGRLADDTFVTVLANVTDAEIGIVLDRIASAITAAPVQLGATEVDLIPQMAATVVLNDGAHDPESLLEDTVRHAEVASGDAPVVTL